MDFCLSVEQILFNSFLPDPELSKGWRWNRNLCRQSLSPHGKR